MKTLGTFLIAFAFLVFLAAVGERFGPWFQDRGIPFSGALFPWGIWIPVGVAALVGGLALRRRAPTE
jgi:hypothetical protein